MQGDCFMESKKKNLKIVGKQFYFHRRFVTCDLRDYAIDNGTTNLILAVGYENIKNLSNPSSSQIAYTMRYTQLIQEPFIIEKPEDEEYKVLEIRANNFSIPSELTTYWCKSFQISQELMDKKHHIVKVKFNLFFCLLL